MLFCRRALLTPAVVIMLSCRVVFCRVSKPPNVKAISNKEDGRERTRPGSSDQSSVSLMMFAYPKKKCMLVIRYFVFKETLRD